MCICSEGWLCIHNTITATAKPCRRKEVEKENLEREICAKSTCSCYQSGLMFLCTHIKHDKGSHWLENEIIPYSAQEETEDRLLTSSLYLHTHPHLQVGITGMRIEVSAFQIYAQLTFQTNTQPPYRTNAQPAAFWTNTQPAAFWTNTQPALWTNAQPAHWTNAQLAFWTNA